MAPDTSIERTHPGQRVSMPAHPRRPAIRRAALAAALVALNSSSLAQPSRTCRVEPFDGATQPQGAVAQMHVVNTGAACSIENFGGTRSIRNPAEGGRITAKPAHGTAEFVGPHARYTPAPGFVGEDEFAYEANAKGTRDQQVLLRVRVKVQVTAEQR
jgi:hypothetical protein